MMADRGAETAAHWDAAFARGDDTRSWFGEHPGMSLRMLGAAGALAAEALIDIDGGASALTETLLDCGFGDLTVLDISAAGTQYARGRLGSRADQVRWLTTDILSWRPRRYCQAWHDRAVFHFLTGHQDRQRCLRTLDTATGQGHRRVRMLRNGRAAALLGPAGSPLQPGPASRPDRFPVAPDQPRQRRAHHPGRHIQPFTWVALRRES
jgi:hypothetical protein